MNTTISPQLLAEIHTGGGGMFFLLFALLIYAFPAYCIQCIAQKSQTEPAWLAWIPIANLYLICKLARSPWWWMLLCLIPYAGIIFMLILLVRVPRVLGVNGPERFLMIVPLVNFVYLGYLAFRTEPAAVSPFTPPLAT